MQKFKIRLLVKFRKKISIKRKQFIIKLIGLNQLLVLNDIKSKILLVGLAPAAHGTNRTGRVLLVINPN